MGRTTMGRLAGLFLIFVSGFTSAAALAAPASESWYAAFNTPGDNLIGAYPLTPDAFGTFFAPATDPQSLTIAGGKLYWIDGAQVLDANLDGSDLSVLQTFGIDPTSIAVNSAGGQWYAGFNTPGDNLIGAYPLTPDAFGTFFAPATDPQSLTIAGGKLYWIDGAQVLDANLDGSDLSVLQTFGVDPTSIAVNSADGQWYAGFNTPGDNLLGAYPLTPDAFGTFFAPATDPQSLTIAGGKLYWIDGAQVLDANLDGSDLSVLQTFGVDPTSIAVSAAPAPSVPEASTWAMILCGFAGLGLLGCRASQRPRQSR